MPDYQQEMYFALSFGEPYNETDYITLLDCPKDGWCLVSTTYDNIDVIVCTFRLNEATCEDRHNGRFPVQPTLDEDENIIRFRSEGIWEEFVRMGWKRKVNTGDTDDYQFQFGNQTSIIWAYGSYNTTILDWNPPVEFGLTSFLMPSNASSYSLLAQL